MVDVMKEIRIEKITLNMGCGNDQPKLEKAMKLLKILSGAKPVKTFTNKRIPEFGLRPGLPIGCKVTLRKDMAKQLLIKFLDAKENILSEDNFDKEGNFSFGISEYIDIQGVEYNPDIGILGFEISVTLERIGFRIKRRKIRKKKIGEKHKITKEEAIVFIKNQFNVKMGEEE